MHIFHNSSLAFLEEQGSQGILNLDTSKMRSHNFTKIEVSKLYLQTLRSVCHCPFCSPWSHLPVRFWYSFVILHSVLVQTPLYHLFFDLTTSLCEVYQINSLILTYYALHGKSILKIWISYCTSGHDQHYKINDSSADP